MGAEENEFLLFGSREESHETGVKLVHNEGWACGLEVDIISSMTFAVFHLIVEEQMKVEKKIEMRKNAFN